MVKIHPPTSCQIFRLPVAEGGGRRWAPREHSAREAREGARLARQALGAFRASSTFCAQIFANSWLPEGGHTCMKPGLPGRGWSSLWESCLGSAGMSSPHEGLQVSAPELCARFWVTTMAWHSLGVSLGKRPGCFGPASSP